jgi:hypothetical protein
MLPARRGSLTVSPGGEHPCHRCASADSDKTNKCHVGVSGECMKDKTGKRRNGCKSEQALDEVSNVKHAPLLWSGRVSDTCASVPASRDVSAQQHPRSNVFDLLETRLHATCMRKAHADEQRGISCLRDSTDQSFATSQVAPSPMAANQKLRPPPSPSAARSGKSRPPG